jgi:hypothetical protein
MVEYETWRIIIVHVHRSMQDFLLQPNYNLVTNGELFPTLSSAQVFG